MMSAILLLRQTILQQNAAQQTDARIFAWKIKPLFRSVVLLIERVDAFGSVRRTRGGRNPEAATMRRVPFDSGNEQRHPRLVQGEAAALVGDFEQLAILDAIVGAVVARRSGGRGVARRSDRVVELEYRKEGRIHKNDTRNTRKIKKLLF